jgi:hypothetical protein
MQGLCKQLRYFVVPFADLSNNKVDPSIVIASVVWSIVVVSLDLSIDVPSDDQGTLTSVLTGTLGFLLPLYLSTCIDKNKRGIELYDAFCGDVIALAWEVASYGDERKKGEMDMCDEGDSKAWKTYKKEVFDILEAAPDILKHVFRGDFQYKEIKNKYVGKALKKIDRPVDLSLGKVQKEDPFYECIDADAAPIEATMFLLVTKIRAIPVDNNKGHLLEIMMKKWNDIYSSYGTAASLIQYKEPLLFSYVLYTAMIIYVVFLPFGFSENSWNNVWIVGIVIYFFISLNSAGVLLQNPFKSIDSDLTIFQTVSGASKNTRCIIRKIEYYGVRKECSYSARTLNTQFKGMLY